MTGLSCRRITSTATFAALIAPFVARDPVGHSVLATSVRRTLDSDETVDVAWWVLERPEGNPVAVGQHVVPYPCGVHGLPDDIAAEAARPVAALLVAEGRAPRGVSGPRAAAEAVATAWARLTGDRTTVTRGLGRWVLDDLRPPPTPGSARPARVDETGLVLRWLDGFQAETGVTGPAHVASTRRRIERGELVLWTVGSAASDPAGAATVSMAGWSSVEAGTSRVGPVWTPPHLRGRGYGSAVTAAATSAALAAGARNVCLYTDLANPVSNAIYARLGYQRVGEEVEISFARP